MFLVNDSVIEFKRELLIDNGLEKVIPFLLSNIVNLESWYGSIVGRGVLTPLFYEDPPILPRLLFQFLSNPSPPFPCHLQCSPPFLIQLSCFSGWMGDHATSDVLSYLMVSWMYPCQAWRPWCVFYATRRHVYWGLTHDVVLCWYSDLISHTQKHTSNSGASRLIHP